MLVTFTPSLAAAVTAVAAGGGSRGHRLTVQIHAQIVVFPHLSPSSASSLLTRLLISLSSSPSLPTSSAAGVTTSYAVAVLRSLPSPSLAAVNAVLRLLSSNPNPNSSPFALYSFLLASPSLRPDHLTFPFLLRHCSLLRRLLPGRLLHAHALRLGHLPDRFVCNGLLFMYASCGRTDDARQVFDEMPNRDLVSYNSMLTGYLRWGEIDGAVDLFGHMNVKNSRSWNIMITGLAQAGRPKEALCLFHGMLAGDQGVTEMPDKITVASVVAACAALGALDQGRWVHGYISQHGIVMDVVIATALIDMYGKCGCVERAREVFDNMPNKDVAAWTAMISAFAVHGLADDAFGIFDMMRERGVKPNVVTFGALLTACVHAGMLDEGRWCFKEMRREYGVEPQLEHYACMVDLLGKAAQFEEAEQLIATMPMEPDAYVWGALLGACLMHKNVDLGERAARKLAESDPLNHASYISLSDIYAGADQFKDVQRVRSYMRNRGIKKTAPGYSAIEADSEVVDVHGYRDSGGVGGGHGVGFGCNLR